MKGFPAVRALLATLTLIYDFSLISPVSGIHITPYEDFCQADIIYHPYIKYYKGRIGAVKTGLPYMTHPPGFWTDIRENDMRNVYLCINGPAMLYYKITTSTTEVYQAPDLKMFVHHCFIANGLPGPGPHYMERTLEAILLIGDQWDYRHPSIQLFTAPWQEKPNSPIINATSLMMIGDNTECILNKGEENTQIRIRTSLTPPDVPKTRKELEAFNKNWAGSYCKLAYQDLVDPNESPIEGPASSVSGTAGPAPAAVDPECQKTGEKPDPATSACKCATFAPDAASGECKACASKTQTADGKACTDCLKPKRIEAGVCKDCTKPWFVDTGSGECAECKAPKYVDGTGACADCAAPKYVDKGDCKDCPAGQTVDPATSTSCKCIEANQELLAGATACSCTSGNEAQAPAAVPLVCVPIPGGRKKRQVGAGPRLEQAGDFQEEDEHRVTSFWTPGHAVSKRQSPFELFQDLEEGDALIRRERGIIPGAKEIAAQMLLHDKVIRIQGCYLPQMATSKTQDIVTKREAQIKTLKEMVDKLKMADYLTKKGLKPTDICQPPTAEVPDADLEPITLQKLIDDQYKELGKLNKKDPGYAVAKRAIEDKMKPLKCRIAGNEAFKQDAHLTAVYQEATDKWTALIASTTTFVGTTEPPLKTANVTMLNAKKAWDEAQKESDQATAKAAYLTAKEDYDTTAEAVDKGFKELAAEISAAESARLRVDAAMKSAKAAYEEFYRVVRLADKGGNPDLMIYSTFPAQPTLIVIKKPNRDDMKETTSLGPGADNACGALPKPKSACASKKPLKQRSCELFKARMDLFKDAAGKERTWKEPENSWRQQVLELVEDIFYGACGPMVKRDYATGISRIIKSYLIDFVEGTLPLTYQIDPNDPSKEELKPMQLAAKRTFWDHIISALQDCKARNFKLQFVKRIGAEREHIYKFVKIYPNMTREEIVVEHLVEQADEEYAFNWAIDSHWRMFATVMGVCMPAYETKIPLITSKFYTHYTEDFFSPLNRTWVDNKDNAVFQKIFGEYYNKRDEMWSKNCMEASFMFSDDRNYRPPRKLMVNRITEVNFFRTGPQAGTTGMYET